VQGLLVRGRISSGFDRTYEIAGGGTLILIHFKFELFYEASQSSRQQPAIHTRVARRFRHANLPDFDVASAKCPSRLPRLSANLQKNS
jgi:hypothetical protein